MADHTHIRDDLPRDLYILTPEEIEHLVKMGVAEARAAATWEEGIDWPVLRLRIGKYVIERQGWKMTEVQGAQVKQALTDEQFES